MYILCSLLWAETDRVFHSTHSLRNTIISLSCSKFAHWSFKSSIYQNSSLGTICRKDVLQYHLTDRRIANVFSQDIMPLPSKDLIPTPSSTNQNT